MKRFLTITDAWHPQINGVVESIRHTNICLEKRGYDCTIIHPGQFKNIPMPGYRAINLAVLPRRKLWQMMQDWLQHPGQIHIATEGPLGWAARAFCLRHDIGFTTAYHTRFPEYIRLRLPVPLTTGYRIIRHFHRPAHKVLVATHSLEQTLATHGFTNMAFWGRGVDTILFHPRKIDTDLPRPIHLYVGRVAIEKNLRAFLDLHCGGSKVIVGDGPDLDRLRTEYPKCHFMGACKGQSLAENYAKADVFVFPSKTDTFGLVMLEALASGVPVAAYPVTGPLDVLGGSGVACLDEDLSVAVTRALMIDRTQCRIFAEQFSWDRATDAFLAHQTDPVRLGQS